MAGLINAAFTRQHYMINTLQWKFKKADMANAEQTNFDDASWQSITIPHDFNGGIDKVNNDIMTGPKMYRGIGWYRTRFTIDNQYQGKQIFIEFEAAALVTDVWLNGTLLGRHKGGYTAFSFDLTPKILFGSENVLAVKVNSANDPTVAPWMYTPFGTYPASYDYAVYGGIYRNVWVTITDKEKIEATFVSTPGLSAASSLVRVKTEVKNYTAASQSVKLTTTVLDSTGALVKTMTNTQDIAAGELFTFDQTSTAVANPILWSPVAPYLYKVYSSLSVAGENIDQCESPLGFRWFTPPRPNGPFTLNGANFFLRGINRHQDRQGYGYALTDEQNRYDIELIKSMGFNFMRHAHYPPAPSVMQACDQLGILLFIECPVTVGMSRDPAFLDNAKSQLTEIIRQNYNHPSALLWSMGNEYDQSVSVVDPNLTEAMINSYTTTMNTLAHSLDPTRPTTACGLKYASNFPLVDAFAPQDWTGWYHGTYNSYAPTQLIGEYGADAAIERHKEPGTQVLGDWSQEYACLLHEAFVARGEARKTLFPGHCVWLLGDFASPRADRVAASGNTINYQNQKGLFLYDHTTPKDVAFFYKSFYTDGAKAPMVYIVSHTWLDRWTAPAAKNVWVYSNCEQVELFNAIGSASFWKANPRCGREHHKDPVSVDRRKYQV